MKLPSKRRIVQFVQYMIGGGVYFWSGYLIVALTYTGLHWSWCQAKILADVIGFTLNYLVQRYWAFDSPGLAMHEGRNRMRYILLSILNIGLDYMIVGGLHMLGISIYIGMFVAAGFFTVWNYVCYRWWIFRDEPVQASIIKH